MSGIVIDSYKFVTAEPTVLDGYQTDVQDPTTNWDNESSAVDGNYTTPASTQVSAGGSSLDLPLQDWSQRTSLPGGATITNIKVSARVFQQSGAGNIDETNVYFYQGSTVNLGAPSAAGPADVEAEGDLSFWGLTNQEAIDALTSTTDGEGLLFSFSEDGSGSRIGYVSRVDIEVTYT